MGSFDKQRHVRMVTESARERETVSYVESILDTFKRNDEGQPPSSDELRTSPDAILTALAQLATHRTNTSRSMISVFDKEYQYIAAEAAPTTSLAPSSQSPPPDCSDSLWLCGTAIPRQHGVCDFTIRAGDLAVSGSDQDDPETKHLPVVKVEDLGTDPNFCTKPYCQPGSPAKFYAAVPIRTRKGINIGSLCVFHGEPVPWWDEELEQIMREISHMVMEYWEGKRSKAAHRRSERMNRGIGSFLEDETTMSGWQDGKSPGIYDDRVGAEGKLNKEQQASQSKGDALGLFRQQQPILETESLPPPTPDAHEEIRDTRPWGTPPVTEPSSPHLSDSVSSSRPHRIHTTVSHTSNSILDRQHAIEHVFDKAANIVRESLEIEGCLFIDPTLTTFGSLVEPSDTKPSTAAVSDQSSGDADERGISEGEGSLQYCRTLGFSTSSAHSINGDTSEANSSRGVAQKFAAVLLRRYPQGKIFNFDSNGELLSSDSSDDSSRKASVSPVADRRAAPNSLKAETPTMERKRKPWAREREGKNISEIFPGARSVAFMPIWGSRKETWFAASFAYTNSPARTFSTRGELTYLKAFGMLAMEQILRLETMHDDKAKSDALSCISHELRSPLHGVLLGAELLNDTEMDVMQSNMVHSLETCCRTMLDTIDHLLDFSNINNVARQSKRLLRENGLRSSKDSGASTTQAAVQLHTLAEEVVNSVFAGFQFQEMSVRQFSQRRKAIEDDVAAHAFLDGLRALDDIGGRLSPEQNGPESPESNPGSLLRDGVQVFFMVDPKCDWTFHANSGAIRRIIMNLFGNSLKYTYKGTIKVTLSQKSHRFDSRKKTRQVVITVADTGIGMSQDYLQNHLFRPFTQENTLSPGTGLGLSLVRQLTSQLRGRISVDSCVGVGTTVTVSLPLKPSVKPDPGLEGGLSSTLAEEANLLRGLRMRLLGFPGEQTTTPGRATSSDMNDTTSTIRSICTDWLQLDVIPESQTGELLPDMMMTSATAYLKEDETFSKGPTLVVCNNALVAHELSKAHLSGPKRDRLVEFVSQPLGPHKLTKALSVLFDRWREAQKASAVASDPSKEQETSSSVQIEPLPTISVATDISSVGKKIPSVSISTLDPANESIPSRPTQPGRTQSVPECTPTDHTNPRLPLRLASSNPPQPSTFHPSEFLLVDDNAINLKILKTYIKKLNLPFSSATNGQEAFDAYKTMNFQHRRCILMDISMPVMDGLESTRHIRAYESKNGIEPAIIITLTGLGSRETQMKALSSGVDMFLTKPVQLKELGGVLRSKGLMPS